MLKNIYGQVLAKLYRGIIETLFHNYMRLVELMQFISNHGLPRLYQTSFQSSSIVRSADSPVLHHHKKMSNLHKHLHNVHVARRCNHRG